MHTEENKPKSPVGTQKDFICKVIQHCENMTKPNNEDSQHIKEGKDYQGDNIIECTRCGAKSGTLKVIEHYFNCTYSEHNKNNSVIDKFYYSVKTPSLLEKTYDKIINVLQGEYCVVPLGENWVIGTFGIGPCISICAIGEYEKEKVILVSHIDRQEKVDEIMELISRIQNPQFYIVGGSYEYSIDDVNKVFTKIIQIYKDSELIYADVLGEDDLWDSRYIAFDLKEQEFCTSSNKIKNLLIKKALENTNLKICLKDLLITNSLIKHKESIF